MYSVFFWQNSCWTHFTKYTEESCCIFLWERRRIFTSAALAVILFEAAGGGRDDSVWSITYILKNSLFAASLPVNTNCLWSVQCMSKLWRADGQMCAFFDVCMYLKSTWRGGMCKGEKLHWTIFHTTAMLHRTSHGTEISLPACFITPCCFLPAQ